MTGPVPELTHLVRLTDQTGLFEHACGVVPRREHGYCTDDAGRALALICDWSDPQADRLSVIYLAFLQRMHVGSGRFILRTGHDPRVTRSGVSDDACGRAILGLGTAASRSDNRSVRNQAHELFARSASFRSPWLHAMAYAGLGAATALAADPEHNVAIDLLNTAASMIIAATGRRSWPEPQLRYANALLPECLLAAAATLHDSTYERLGLRMLDWLVAEQTAPAGHFSFTPTRVFDRAGRGRPAFDQQPIEAGAMADAAARAFALTGDDYWAQVTIRAAEWFTGRNDLAVFMADGSSGGCFDGLQPEGPNLNQGAESTIAMLTAMRQARMITAQLTEACPP